MNNSLPRYTEAKNSLSLKQKVGQLFMPAAFINDSEEEVQKMEHLIRTLDIGSLCFFHSRASAATNFEGKKEVVHNEKSYDRLVQLIERYQKAAKIPLLIAIDAEWGLAMRIENTPHYPYAITLGAIQEQDDLLVEVGKRIGLDCLKAGMHWNLSPVVDVNNNPENPVIGYRSFGDDAEKVSTKSEAFIKGMSSVGVLNSLKHFPGHGDTATDSHLGLPVIDKSKEELLANELFPFRRLVEQGVDSVMVGHLSVPSLDPSGNPATTSNPIITNLLREELGFKGVIISDALNMHAVSKKYSIKGTLEVTALQAGMDMMCFSEYPKEGIDEILNAASETRIEESFKRVWGLKEKAFLGKTTETQIITGDADALNRSLAQCSLTEYYGNPNALAPLKKNGFLNLVMGKNDENSFSQAIEQNTGEPYRHVGTGNLDEIKKAVTAADNVVLALFPPAVKPKGLFGFEPSIVEFVGNLLSNKNVLVYLFGNPYVADVLGADTNSNLVFVYQDFRAFQEIAFEHFQGKLKAQGKLPIQLKCLQNKN
ncbi:glycoside hydrolase family 3 protein [Flagellimonas myxillae]|uniref:glycoside hydrolase family 3 protein n=1 Tax=Flagellimonas myxillae TaxID=2942214 RepID=UPI00201F244D|nr:glycoside hydrolase family 3 protein [Muricauda myxillae]MCL6265401.1 glycoside hydrolase family 3 protein [Muricauda myxillae]